MHVHSFLNRCLLVFLVGLDSTAGLAVFLALFPGEFEHRQWKFPRLMEVQQRMVLEPDVYGYGGSGPSYQEEVP